MPRAAWRRSSMARARLRPCRVPRGALYEACHLARCTSRATWHVVCCAQTWHDAMLRAAWDHCGCLLTLQGNGCGCRAWSSWRSCARGASRGPCMLCSLGVPLLPLSPSPYPPLPLPLHPPLPRPFAPCPFTRAQARAPLRRAAGGVVRKSTLSAQTCRQWNFWFGRCDWHVRWRCDRAGSV